MSNGNNATSTSQSNTGQDIENPDKVFDTSGLEAALAQNNITRQNQPQELNNNTQNENKYVSTVEQVVKDRAAT